MTFYHFCIWATFGEKENVDLASLLRLSSPSSFRASDDWWLFAQDPQLYATLFCLHKENINLIRRYHHSLGELALPVDINTKMNLLAHLIMQSDWFGDYFTIYEEGGALLQKSQ